MAYRTSHRCRRAEECASVDGATAFTRSHIRLRRRRCHLDTAKPRIVNHVLHKSVGSQALSNTIARNSVVRVRTWFMVWTCGDLSEPGVGLEKSTRGVTAHKVLRKRIRIGADWRAVKAAC